MDVSEIDSKKCASDAINRGITDVTVLHDPKGELLKAITENQSSYRIIKTAIDSGNAEFFDVNTIPKKELIDTVEKCANADGLTPKIFEKAVSKVMQEYDIPEAQAGCYIAYGGRDEYLCKMRNGRNGGCTCLKKCQEIYSQEQKK